MKTFKIQQKKSDMPEEKSSRRSLKARLLLLATLCALGTISTALYVYILNKPPHDFATPTIVTIELGTSIKTITAQLEAASVVKSQTFLYYILSFLYEPSDVKASTYIFDSPLTTLQIAKRLVAGDFSNDLIRFTHYEGERATSIAENAETALINFDKERFLERAIPLEGRLYPETYHIPKTFTADELIDIMLQTFIEETHSIQPFIDAHTLTAEEIITLASILEREANSPESMRIVSGILQGRMVAGMPLQADASIEYILNKPLKELTSQDLEIDSPYNTYLNRGLPPTPIGNPGIDAIMAALQPEKTDYVYYITDKEGNFHYAVTYDEHLNNIERYLR
ncbi:MAG: endolytic transglycosylase MltG [Candidatus Pacebacteria bacterium]|nr:endolytic transglycosylase MltG [Candidatus Paceibacterota bacterium]